MDSAESAPDAYAIRGAIPQEAVDQVHDPAVALLVTLYILHMGQIVGEEMAATVGFPAFPTDRSVRLGSMRDLRHHLDPQHAIDIVEGLEQRLRPLASATDIVEEDISAEEELLAAAILNSGKRTDLQSRILAKALSAIASESAHGRQDLEYWEHGIKGVTQITRLMIEAVPPTRVGTMRQLRNQGSGLRTIATLGGALFLGSSLRVLAEEDQAGSRSRYAQLGLRLAELTQHMGGQQVQILNSEEAMPYKNGLREFALRGGSVFAIEHPFHFRVLLEVMSDENRRYPAEPVLNVEAMRHIWPGNSLWSNIVWSRDQLPVVVNLIRHPDNQRADAFIQHYAAFGRTPHTSSFTHLDYEVRSPVGNSAVTSWPVAFQDYRDRPVQNMPNSVCEAVQSIERQRRLGRLWRGEPEAGDLNWLCGQLVAWDEHRESDGTLAARIWRSSSWLGHTLPVTVMAEIRTGAWLLEALRLRLAAAVSPTGRDLQEPHSGQERPDPERRAAEELRCVLEIMVLFATDYISGKEDGISGLKKTLDQLRHKDWFIEMGPRLGGKLHYLEISLDVFGNKISEEVAAARKALAGPGGHAGA